MSDWSKRKRLEATINGQQPDRPPVALWRHWPGDDQQADALAAAHLKWQNAVCEVSTVYIGRVIFVFITASI